MQMNKVDTLIDYARNKNFIRDTPYGWSIQCISILELPINLLSNPESTSLVQKIRSFTNEGI